MKKALTALLLIMSLAAIVCSAEDNVQSTSYENGRLNIENPEITDGVLTLPYIYEGNECEAVTVSKIHGAPLKFDKLIVSEGVKDVFFVGIEPDVIELPASIEKLSGRASKAYIVADGNNSYYDIDGVLFSKDKKALLKYGTERSEKRYVVPDGVETITSESFCGCSALENIVFDQELKRIERDAFRDTSLNDIDFPEGLEYIDISAVLYTPWYKESVKEWEAKGQNVVIGDGILFYAKAGGDFKTDENVKTIAGSLFMYKSEVFDSVTIGGNVKTIGDRAFRKCNIKDAITIENGVENIGMNAFAEINVGYEYWYAGHEQWIDKVVLPGSIKNLAFDAFYKADIEEIYFPKAFDADALSFCRAKCFVEKGSEFQEKMSRYGYLTFDLETGRSLLPEYDESEIVGFYIFVVGSSGENNQNTSRIMTFPGSLKPFMLDGSLYVPLRHFCGVFDIPLYWNADLNVAEVGERGVVERHDNAAWFGDESIVRYNGKVAQGNTSAVNINGNIYVPLKALAESGLIDIRFSYGTSAYIYTDKPLEQFSDLMDIH